jgi:hypothetical protein
MAITINGTNGLTTDNGALKLDTDTLVVDDTNNRVGIGTSSPGATLTVAGGAMRLDSGQVLEFGGSTNFILGETAPNNLLRFYTNNTERMRITSTGAVGIGTTTPGARLQLNGAPSQGAGLVQVGTDGYAAWDFRNTAGAQQGYIQVNTSSVAYVSVSDYRLKENVVEITDGIDRVKLLNPSRFNFIADSDTTVDGFLAHEAQAVVPEAVTGTHNEVDADGNPVMQGIDQSKLVPLLTAALQEAITKIEALEARVTALENA